MNDYSFRLLNVFTLDGKRLSGNPLCVFEDGRGLDDATMQALALQFHLSETTFLLPSDEATAAVRIFTPSFEMPFAGHPTLGSAHVVRELTGADDAVTLEMTAGVIPVTAEGDRWTFEANAPRSRLAEATPGRLAEMLGLPAEDVLEGACWVDTGSEQLMIPLRSHEALARSKPVPELLERYARATSGDYLAYLFAEVGGGEVRARFFFPTGGSVTEDPATGSACANLGGWLLQQEAPLPLERVVRQGDPVGRPSRLLLRVDRQRRIFVSGDVIELGRGTVTMASSGR